MQYFTRVDQGRISYLYSHQAQTLYVFPQIHNPKQMTLKSFWRNLSSGKLLARREKIPFSVSQYCCSN